MAKSLDIQVGGNHYKGLRMQPAELIAKLNLDFFAGNIIKYVTRYKGKNGEEDLKKAIHYCNLRIDLLNKVNVVYDSQQEQALTLVGEYCVVNKLNEYVYCAFIKLMKGNICGARNFINDLLVKEYGNKDD